MNSKIPYARFNLNESSAERSFSFGRGSRPAKLNKSARPSAQRQSVGAPGAPVGRPPTPKAHAQRSGFQLGPLFWALRHRFKSIGCGP